MLREEIHKWFRKLFAKGANTDVEKELLGEGLYYDAYMMRPVSADGTTGSLTKVGGEQLLFSSETDEVAFADSMVCIGACVVTGAHVSFWASTNPGVPPCIKINGVTMVRSAAIPYVWDFPLQFGEVSNCIGGIIFPADRRSPALFWDIPAIQAAYDADEETYFSQFNLQSVSVIPPGPEEWPEHIGNPNLGDGLPPGQYIYDLRYVDAAGNRSNRGPQTPPIAVAAVQAPIYVNNPVNDQYPGAQTVGGIPTVDVLTPTPYGIALKFQVNNTVAAQFIEVCRRRFNDGQGLAGPGIDEVVGRLETASGELSIRYFTDPLDSNVNPAANVIPTDEANSEHVNFTAPGAVEHVDNRVIYADIQLQNLIVDLEFRSVGGAKIFPVTQRVFTRWNGQEYNDGYADPVNNTYMKSALHHERYGIGIMLRDGVATRSPVFQIEDNHQMPARGTRKTGDSARFSTDPIYRGIDECQSNDPVAPSFDAIVQGNKSKPSDVGANQVNVLDNQYPYNPWSPTAPDDPNYTRYRTEPIFQWETSQGVYQTNAGNIFSQQYHALGVGIYGPQNLGVAAPWARVMTVMRTEPANRLIASGIASYRLDQANNVDDANRSKQNNQVNAFFPDIDSGLVSLSVIQDVEQNPQNYRLRVTPFGFHPEMYAHRFDVRFVVNQYPPPTFIPEYFTGGVDLITYAGVQFDPGDGQPGSVNVGEPAGLMGIQPTISAPSVPGNYVNHRGWRRLTADMPANTGDTSSLDYSIFTDNVNNPIEQGAVEIGMESFSLTVEGRGNYYRIVTSQNLYRASGHTAAKYANETPTRRFHEGLYVVDLIRTAATVPTVNLQPYINTGTHIVVAPEGRCIGTYQPDPVLGYGNVELFHARVFDAVGRFSVDQRYAYVLEDGQPEKRWLCATNNSVVFANFLQIIADINANGFWIAPDGFRVYGLYTHVQDLTNPHPIDYLRFGVYTQIPAPAIGARINVKYDPLEPIISQGFDGTIAPAIFAPIDRSFNAANGTISNDGGNTQLYNGAPMIYNGGINNPNYFLPRNGPTGPNEPLEQNGFSNVVAFRQWVVMADLVTRTPQRLNVSNAFANSYPFPRTHYIPRPSGWINYDSGQANGFYLSFDVDFPGEATWFGFGGFRFVTTDNLDYAKQPTVTGIGVPINGRNQVYDLCTSYIASDRRDPLTTDSPGLRTFRRDNLFTVSDENGRIMMIHALDQGGMQQLYGWCERGYHRIPYNKQILVGADGNTIGTQAIGNFWPREEIWKARGEKGCPGYAWRFAVKANAASGQGGDADTVFWGDYTGAYKLVGDTGVPIARGKRLSKLLPFLQAIPNTGTGRWSSLYNETVGEVWMCTDGTVSVFSAVNNEWVGVFAFLYDQFVSLNGQLIGYRKLSGNTLDVGFEMLPFNPGGRPEPVEGWFEMPFVPYPGQRSELIAWRVNPDKPDELRIFDKDHVLMLTANEALQEAVDPGTGFLWVMLIDGYQQMMNSVDQSYADLQYVGDRQPPQSTSFYMKVFYRRAEPQRCTFAWLQAKPLP